VKVGKRGARARWAWGRVSLLVLSALCASGAQAQILVDSSGDLVPPAPMVTNNLRSALERADLVPTENRIVFSPVIIMSTIDLINGALPPVRNGDLTINGSPVVNGLVTVNGADNANFFTVMDNTVATLIGVNLTSGGVDVESGSTLVYESAGGFSSSAVYSGDGSLVKRGDGRVTFTSILSSRTGATTVESGVLAGVVNSAFSGDITVLGGATIELMSGTGDDVFTPQISGEGGLTKSGSQRLELTGTNNYTGTTTVEAGTLAGSFPLAGPFSVNSGGTLELMLLGDATLDVTGSGTVDKLDSQLLTLSGSEFTGSVNVRAGELRGTTTSIQADVMLMTDTNAVPQPTALQFTGGGTYDGNLTSEANTAILRKIGAGTLVLGGNTTGFTGTIDRMGGGVQGSTANLSAAPSIETGTGLTTQVLIDEAGVGTFSTPINGDGSVVKLGAGTLTFASPLAYTGQTIVNAGRLNVMSGGTLVSSDAVVGSGGVLGGDGTIPGGIVNRGTIAPGTAGIPGAPGVIADLNAGSTVDFDPGSELKISLFHDPMTAPTVVESDTLIAAGAVTIDPAGTAALDLQFTGLVPDTTVVTPVIQTASSITGGGVPQPGPGVR
jgi:autotransporter-associated beta strand protein